MTLFELWWPFRTPSIPLYILALLWVETGYLGLISPNIYKNFGLDTTLTQSLLGLLIGKNKILDHFWSVFLVWTAPQAPRHQCNHTHASKWVAYTIWLLYMTVGATLGTFQVHFYVKNCNFLHLHQFPNPWLLQNSPKSLRMNPNDLSKIWTGQLAKNWMKFTNLVHFKKIIFEICSWKMVFWLV